MFDDIFDGKVEHKETHEIFVERNNDMMNDPCKHYGVLTLQVLTNQSKIEDLDYWNSLHMERRHASHGDNPFYISLEPRKEVCWFTWENQWMITQRLFYFTSLLASLIEL